MEWRAVEWTKVARGGLRVAHMEWRIFWVVRAIKVRTKNDGANMKAAV